MNRETINLAAVLPTVALSVIGVLIMALGPFSKRGRPNRMGLLALLGVIAAAFALVPMMNPVNRGFWYSGLWVVDDYSAFFHATFLLIAGLTALGSMDYLRRQKMDHPEYYALLMFATAGMLTMAASEDLIVIFIGLEALSISTYVLAGFRRTDLKSNESAMKYFLLGSFASAFFLYGIALIFGATGSTNLAGIADGIRLIGEEPSGTSQIALVYLAAALMLIALCFKVAAAPFHVWTPDVYEGAPTPVTAFMSVGPKAAGFAVLLRVFVSAFGYPSLQDRWQAAIGIIAILTMTLGNIVATVQPNIKRMLAYSSIAHAGYVAVGLAAAAKQPDGAVSAALFYLLAYAATNLGAFAIVSVLGRSEDKLTNVSDYAGLARKRPVLAALLSLFLLSLAGVPGTAGFTAKFFIFRAAVDSGLYSLASVGALTTVVSFYFYLYVIVQMYMREPHEDFADVGVPATGALLLAVAAVATVYLGVWPNDVLNWSLEAARSLH
ncbi:MAG TPA: NADH-quinone oxidoreductase subunit N [Terriglobia bacterium]|nr:NADH-quinone oxidoreductase subunit N [Terriglobia bacterium]